MTKPKPNNELLKKIKPKFSIRFVGYCICIIVSFIGYYIQDWVLGETPKPFDVFSYIGTFATLIGLIITMCEVFRSMTLSQELKEKIDEITDLDIERKLSFLQSTLDHVISSVENEKYTEGLIYFRILNKIFIDFSITDDKLTEAELQLSTAYKAQNRFSKPQKKYLKELLIKDITSLVSELVIKARPYLSDRVKERSNDSTTNS